MRSGISTIGLDLAKNVFQVHGIDAQGKVLVRRPLRRAEVLPFFAKLSPCLVGMEAFATAHHWGRELTKLGHTVKLMLPAPSQSPDALMAHQALHPPATGRSALRAQSRMHPR